MGIETSSTLAPSSWSLRAALYTFSFTAFSPFGCLKPSVTIHRHVGLAEGDDDGAARRGPTGGIAHPVRIVDGSRRVRVAPAREAEVLAVRLADDLATLVEDAADDGRVEVRNIALERRGAVHHRHAGEHDVVLDRHALALELAGRRALDRRLAVPRVVPVLLRAGPVARRARVPDRGNLVRHRVDRVVGRDVPGEELTEGFGIGAAQ